MDPNDWTLTGNAGTNPATNFLGTTDNEPLIIKTNGVEALRIDPAGNVGIGTASPGRRLTLAGGPELALRLQDNTVPTGTFWELQASAFVLDNFGIVRYEGGVAQGSKSLLIAPSGNVGIGTISPGAKLEVNGDVQVTGDVILTGADCAEEFDIAEAGDIEPGTVMVIQQDGTLQQSWQAYDKRVAGVISGAGDYRAGLILDRQQSSDNRVPVALVGKVYCKVDAQYAAIEVGDLLTTSPTPGHAMKADDPLKAFGSVIGKALQALQSGQGLVPILVTLQ